MADPGLFSFFGNTPSGAPGSYGSLEMRRKIALAMMAGNKKGYPKNIGEGLTAIGDSLGEMGMMRRLDAEEAARNSTLGQAAVEAQNPGGAPIAATPGPRADATPADTPQVAAAPAATTVAALSPDEQNAGVVDPGAVNTIDAMAPSVPTSAEQSASIGDTGYKPAPGYLQQKLAELIQDPERRGYLGQLAGKEAQSPNEVSPTGAAGPFQFIRSTGKQYGLVGPGGDKRTDIAASILAANKLTDDNAAVLARGLGRPPSPSELALAHQQGAGTAVRMLTGTGNAPARNLAVNNAGGLGSNAAAQKIMAYYGMPGGGGPAMTPAAGPMTASDAAGEARLADVTGMSGGDTGNYSYPATASLGREGDMQSDLPNVNGISPQTGGAIADTVQQRNEIAKRLLQGQMPPAQGVPQPNPTQPGPTTPSTPTPPINSQPPMGSVAAANGPSVPDVRPISAAPVPVPGAQLAQAQMLPAVSPPGTVYPPPPTAPAEPRVQPEKVPIPKVPELEPKSPAQIANEARLLKAEAMGDPDLTKLYSTAIATTEKDRQDNYARRVEQYKAEMQAAEAAKARAETFRLAEPQRNLELQKAEDERAQRNKTEALNKMLGYIPQETYITKLNKSQENISGLPAAMQSVKRARDIVDNNKAFFGAGSDINTSLTKLGGTMGFPIDPKASGTEQFKTAMGNIMAMSRKAIVGAGAQSEAELQLLQKTAAADTKLEPETIRQSLAAAEHLMLTAALQHQQGVRRFAGEDPERQAQVYGQWAVPNDTMMDVVPKASISKLMQHANDPQVMRDFDNTYHTPGLSRDVIRRYGGQ